MPLHFTKKNLELVIDSIRETTRLAAFHGLTSEQRTIVADHLAKLRLEPSLDIQFTIKTDPKTKATSITFLISPEAFGQRRN